MVKNKKKLRAKRKFAQGAFIPPQNNLSTSASAPVTHASHRAVNEPGPVIHNYCSAKDILTRMSLGKAHPHENWQPVVRIEYDCGSTTRPPESTQKRKIKNKKKHKVINYKKKYVLRNRQKSLAMNFPDTRRVSISNSGEDTPLSFLTSTEVPKASIFLGAPSVVEREENSKVILPISPSRSAARPRKRPVVKQPEHHTRRLSASQKPAISTAANGRTALDTVNTEPLIPEKPASLLSSQVQPCATLASLRSSLTSPSTSPVLPRKSPTPPRMSPVPVRNWPVSSRTSPVAACTSPVPARITPVPDRNLPVSSRTSPVAACTSPVPARITPVPDRNLPVSSRTSPVAACTSPVPARIAPVPDRNLPVSSESSPVPACIAPEPVRTPPADTSPRPTSVSPVPACTSPVLATISPVAMLRTSLPPEAPKTPDVMHKRLRKKRPYFENSFVYDEPFTDTSSVDTYNCEDPDYELSSSASTVSSEYVIKRKPKTAKKKAIGNVVRSLKALEASRNKTPLIADGGFSSTADADSIPVIEPLANTARWIDSHHNAGILSTAVGDSICTKATTDNTRLIVSGNEVLSALGIIRVDLADSALTAPESPESSAPASGEPSSPKSRSIVASERSTSDQAAVDGSHFKLPYLRIFRAKYNKNNCPTRLFDDLQELLNSQPDKNGRNCNACQRCELLSKYKKVFRKLPVSDANEPDILDTTPRDVYEFDSDDEGFKFLRRGRELVRTVLTTKRLPIWLSNLEMNLKKTMFLDEHKLGTLKRTIKFNNSDAMVTKVITRVDYLNRCISEDKKELDAEKSRKRLRSAQGAVSTFGRKKQCGLRRAPIDKPNGTTDNDHTPDMNTDPELPTEASTPPASNERHLVVCLMPLEEMVERGRAPPAVNATQSNGGKAIPLSYGQSSVSTEHLISEIRNEPAFASHPQYNIINESTVLCNSTYIGQDESFTESDFMNNGPIQISENTQQPPPSPNQVINLVYRPTPEEFKDPIAYIEKIQKKASKYGICKIIPPTGFDVPCHLDDNSIFTTINQYLGRLYQRWGPTSRKMTIIQSYVAMLADSRERDQFTEAPMFDGVELDLVKLYHIVLKNGGIEELFVHSEKWARIAEQMCLVSPRGKPDHKKLEKLYCKHVLPYESLSHYDRQKIQCEVDQVWSERYKSALRRAERPLHYQKRMLGETQSDDDEEPPPCNEPVGVRLIGKQCFDKTEECTGKGRTMNLATYRRIAAQIQAMRFGNGPAPTTLDVENDYWSILTLGNEHVSVLSAFIDTSVDSLGHTSDPDQPGGSHPWNLKRLSENPRNVLSSLGKTLSVTVPTLCLNQVFSTNCWHMDPHKLAWMDYMHEGTTKIWYAVSEHDAKDFRRAMALLVPAAVQNKDIWLASDTTMVPPTHLIDKGVKLQRLEQNPGEFIVVFPGAYASSIATGLTISESIYFENKFWLYNIDHIFQQMRVNCEPAMFSNTLLLLRMARDPKVSADVLLQVHHSVKALIEDELHARREAIKFKCAVTLDQSGRPDRGQTPISWPHQDECSICRAPLILSKTVRYNDHRSLMCLNHGLRVYSVAPVQERGPCGPPVTLLYSYIELQEINQALERRILDVSLPMTKR